MKKIDDLPEKKGGWKKIKDLEDKRCTDREHNPPMHVSLPDGIYEHRCPSCGNKTIITVRNPTCSDNFTYDDDFPDSIIGTEDGI